MKKSGGQFRPLYDKLMEKAFPEPNTGCWLWAGAITDNGYGILHVQVGSRRLPRRAHRLMYEMLRGPVDSALHMDHLCRNRSCVNPDHLEPVTVRENIMRGVGYTAQQARKTHCKRGHPFDQENTMRVRNGKWRMCRKCKKLYPSVLLRRRGKTVPA